MESPEEFIDDWIEMEIGKLEDSFSSVLEGLGSELPEEIWPPSEVVDSYEMFIVGSVFSSIEWLAVIAIDASDGLSPDDVDTTDLRRYAREEIKSRRGDIEEALTV